MKMILRLTQVQLGSALDFISLFRKKNTKTKNKSVSLIFLMTGILFAIISGAYSYVFGLSFQMAGQLTLLPGFMMAVVCMVTLTMTIYKVKGTLFGTKDYDILMSLPVPTTYIVASRILLLYCINFFFTAILAIPNMIIYGYLARPPVEFYLRFFFALAFVPLVPMILACVFGILAAAIASKFRHSNLVNTILFLILILFIFGISFQMQQEEQIAVLGDALTKQIERIYPLAGMYIHGVVEGNWIQLGVFLIISGSAFIVFCIIIGKLFLKLNTSITGVTTKSNYKIKEYKKTTPFRALFFKEIKRVFFSTIYFLNSCISMILMTIAVLVVTIVRPEKIIQMLQVPQMMSLIKQMMPFLLAMLVGMTFSASCSISLEGKSLWILRSVPVDVKTIFKSKIAVNLILVLPLLTINTILLGVFFKLSLLEFVITFLIPVLYSGFVSIGGLLLNLKFPLLNWTNETVVIKQSAASMLTSLGGMLCGIIPILLLTFFSIPAKWIFAGTALVVGLLILLFWKLLTTWGIKRFESL